MPKKEKILDKLKYKDYNNLLEQVLEKKEFPSLGKNLILSILYKMETNYNDYRTVKRDVSEKEEILENFIGIVKNNCDKLKLIKPDSKKSILLNNKASKYITNIKNKEVEVFPNERYILEGLYSLFYNEKMVKDKYGILKEAITEVLLRGNSSNNIELLRDFNGFSWFISSSEFEDVASNLIFQDIRIIAGNELLSAWIQNKESSVDYIEKLKKELNRRYEKEMADQLFNQILVTILKIYIQRQPNKKKELQKTEEPKDDMAKYLEDVSKAKKKLLNRVKKIDKCINDNDTLRKEFELRKDISSIKELKELLIAERKACMDKISEYNKAIDPRQFMKRIKTTVKKVELFDYNSVLTNSTTALEELIKLQKLFLKSYKILADKLTEKKEILELIYEFRYYNLIPITDNELIKDNEYLKDDIENMREFLINKAIEEKIINNVNSNNYINMEVLKNIFSLRIINLENTEVYMLKIQNGIKIDYLEGDLEETSKKITIPEGIGRYRIKERKNIKIFS